MEYGNLLNLGAELGYRLMVSGAEIYRTEDSVLRLFAAYGLDSGEVFAIPNSLTVSLLSDGGEPLTRIRRVPPHGTNVALLERYNALCRELCRDTPSYEEAMARLDAVAETFVPYPFRVRLLAYFLGAWSFSIFFGGGLIDAAAAGIGGVVVGLCLTGISLRGSNVFIKTLMASTLLALLAYLAEHLWPVLNADLIVIGAFMHLVPGVAFTTALRDIMAGDMISGLAKAAEGILIAVALALGTGIAMNLARALWGG